MYSTISIECSSSAHPWTDITSSSLSLSTTWFVVRPRDNYPMYLYQVPALPRKLLRLLIRRNTITATRSLSPTTCFPAGGSSSPPGSFPCHGKINMNPSGKKRGIVESSTPPEQNIPQKPHTTSSYVFDNK